MKTVLANHSILYVEDDLSVQANMREYLESFFKLVYVACDGKEALTLYEKYKPDALILDINLPYEDGLSVAKKIRKKDKYVSIIMLTAHTDEEKLLRAVELKLTKYLVKPVSPKAFKEALDLLAKEFVALSDKFISLCESFIWKRDTKQLLRIEEEIVLTQKERKLLALLVDHRGECVSFEEIMAVVWDESYDQEISIDSVKSQVSYLRKKLPKNLIESVYGKGYLLK
ncbi:MAG: response regulator transcription factor [Epsilonproteobacteria bacterium]|nr:response regulator transcription factor [Campylobacterota bacterium]